MTTVFTADTPHRKSNRGRFHDQSAPGCYFVTICVHDRICCLGEVDRGRMIESECGRIVRDDAELERIRWYIRQNPARWP